ncbi:MAG: hypothetical protein IT370_04700 [Deltaproteobacteria bacterium]|nr:hypothetical protein [Deltaproteobacteria bacterium]
MRDHRAIVLALLVGLLLPGCPRPRGICDVGGGGDRTASVTVQNGQVGNISIDQRRTLTTACHSHGAPAQNVFSPAYGWVNVASIGAVAHCDTQTDRDDCRRVAFQECRQRLIAFIQTSGGGFLAADCSVATCDSCMN